MNNKKLMLFKKKPLILRKKSGPLKNKRKYFIFITFVAGALYFLSQMVPFGLQYQAVLTLVFWVGLLLFLLFRKIAEKKANAVIATFLPVSFVVGISMFSFLFSQDWIWQVILLLVFFVGFYTLLLVENVFLVSIEFKTVPLYRAASTVSLLSMLFTGFLLFDVLFSFRLAGWLNGLIVILVSMLLFSHFFWTVNLDRPFSKNNALMAFTFSLILGEIALALSFWPVGVGKGSLYLVSIFYVFGGLAQAFCKERLFKKTILEFIWIGLGTFLALFLVTSWRGNF